MQEGIERANAPAISRAQTTRKWRLLQEDFSFQGGETRLALAMAEVPPEALATSDKAAWTLVLLGSAVAVVGPLLGGARGKISKPRSRRSRAARP